MCGANYKNCGTNCTITVWNNVAGLGYHITYKCGLLILFQKVILKGSFEGIKTRETLRSCDANCAAGETPLLDPHGDKSIGTRNTFCCDGDMCNRGLTLVARIDVTVAAMFLANMIGLQASLM